MSNCPNCGERWVYTLTPNNGRSGCPTCGPDAATFEISRECVRCRRPQTIQREVQSFEFPQEFSSPELDAWFVPVWEADGGPQREAAARAAAKERARIEDVKRRAMSFLPPEYRKDRT